MLFYNNDLLEQVILSIKFLGVLVLGTALSITVLLHDASEALNLLVKVIHKP